MTRSGTACSLLAPRFFPAAADIAPAFGRRGSSAPRSHLHPDHFVYGVIIHLCPKNGIAQIYLRDTVIFNILHTGYWHFSTLKSRFR